MPKTRELTPAEKHSIIEQACANTVATLEQQSVLSSSKTVLQALEISHSIGFMHGQQAAKRCA